MATAPEGIDGEMLDAPRRFFNVNKSKVMSQADFANLALQAQRAMLNRNKESQENSVQLQPDLSATNASEPEAADVLVAPPVTVMPESVPANAGGLEATVSVTEPAEVVNKSKVNYQLNDSSSTSTTQSPSEELSPSEAQSSSKTTNLEVNTTAQKEESSTKSVKLAKESSERVYPVTLFSLILSPIIGFGAFVRTMFTNQKVLLNSLSGEDKEKYTVRELDYSVVKKIEKENKKKGIEISAEHIVQAQNAAAAESKINSQAAAGQESESTSSLTAGYKSLEIPDITQTVVSGEPSVDSEQQSYSASNNLDMPVTPDTPVITYDLTNIMTNQQPNNNFKGSMPDHNYSDEQMNTNAVQNSVQSALHTYQQSVAPAPTPIAQQQSQAPQQQIYLPSPTQSQPVQQFGSYQPQINEIGVINNAHPYLSNTPYTIPQFTTQPAYPSAPQPINYPQPSTQYVKPSNQNQSAFATGPQYVAQQPSGQMPSYQSFGNAYQNNSGQANVSQPVNMPISNGYNAPVTEITNTQMHYGGQNQYADNTVYNQAVTVNDAVNTTYQSNNIESSTPLNQMMDGIGKLSTNSPKPPRREKQPSTADLFADLDSIMSEINTSGNNINVSVNQMAAKALDSIDRTLDIGDQNLAKKFNRQLMQGRVITPTTGGVND